MPSEELSVQFLDIHCAYNGIEGAQVVILYFIRIDIVSYNKVMPENFGTVWR